MLETYYAVSQCVPRQAVGLPNTNHKGIKSSRRKYFLLRDLIKYRNPSEKSVWQFRESRGSILLLLPGGIKSGPSRPEELLAQTN